MLIIGCSEIPNLPFIHEYKEKYPQGDVFTNNNGLEVYCSKGIFLFCFVLIFILFEIIKYVKINIYYSLFIYFKNQKNVEKKPTKNSKTS